MEFQILGRYVMLWVFTLLYVPCFALSKYYYYPMYYPRRVAYRHVTEFVPYPVVKTEVLFVEKDPKDVDGSSSSRTPSSGKNKGYVPYKHFESEDKEIVRELVHGHLDKLLPKTPAGSSRIPFPKPSWSNLLSVTAVGESFRDDSWRPITIPKDWETSSRIPKEQGFNPKRMKCKCESDDSE